MENISVICPLCKKQLKVNPSEEVVFCSFCNKPFAVEDAIEQLSCNEAAKKPSNEAITKFNAILEQDYKLAEKYLEGVINKEYSQDCKKYLLFRCSSYSSLSTISGLDTLSKEKIEIENNLNSIRSANHFIAEMYYKILCASVNNMLPIRNVKGELAFLKIRLHDVEERFSVGLQSLSGWCVDDCKELFGYVIQRWETLISDISQYKCWLQQEYDDEYISYIISKIKGLQYLSVQYRTTKQTYWGVTEEKRNFNISRALEANHISVDDVINLLEELYSPIQQEKIKRAREEIEKKREEEKRLEQEKKYKEAFDREVAFWNQYIALLNKNKIKQAYELLKTAGSKAYKIEIIKFKKGLFGFKYLGDVAMLQAEELAELSVDDSK